MPKGIPKNGINKGWFNKADKKLIGNKFAVGNKPNKTSFKRGEHKSISTEFKKGIVPLNKGTKKIRHCFCGKALSDIRSKLCREHSFKQGHWNWKGGITKPSIRNKSGYKTFRNSIIKRDDGKCRLCESKDRLEIHHIIPFSFSEKLRFDSDNIITLCRKCHKKTDTYGAKIKRTNFKKI